MNMRYAFLFLYMAIICSLLVLGGSSGCTREYSFEGADTLAVHDSIPVDTLPIRDSNGNVLNITSCMGCSNLMVEEQWSVEIGNALLCGEIDTAILNKERDAFTFFGPSHCSLDSGLIISAWLNPEILNRDRQNLTTTKVSMYYYDNLSGPYMLQSRQDKPFALTILKYDHVTKAAEGSFTGSGFTVSGKEVVLENGRWKTFLK